MPNLAELATKGNATYGIDATPLKGNATYGVDATPTKGNATYGVDATPVKGNATYDLNFTPTKSNSTYDAVDDDYARQLHKSTLVDEQRVGPAFNGNSSGNRSLTASPSIYGDKINDSVEVQSLMYSKHEENAETSSAYRAGRDSSLSSASTSSVASSSSNSGVSSFNDAVNSSSSSPEADTSVNASFNATANASVNASPGLGDASMLPPNISAISRAILSASSDSPTELGKMIMQLSQQADNAKKVS